MDSSNKTIDHQEPQAQSNGTSPGEAYHQAETTTQQDDSSNATNAAEETDAYISMVNRSMSAVNQENNACPYHTPILKMHEHAGKAYHQSTAMQRYLSETSREGSVLFVRSDGTVVASSDGCLCGQTFEDGFSAAQGGG